jgi:hypothetical protein
MHKSQQLIVLIGFGLIVLMGIFPPWSLVDDNKVAHFMGYAPIWKPPVNRSQETAQIFGIKLQLNMQSEAANSIDFAKLILQIAIVAVVTGGTVMLAKRASA